MKLLKGAIQEIESQDFALKLGLASGSKNVLSIALSTSSAIQLENELKSSPKIAILLLWRIHKISNYEIDRRFVNPFDYALTVYLFLLRNYSPQFVRIAANFVQQIPRCWWAEKLSRDILMGKPLQSDEIRIELPGTKSKRTRILEKAEDVMESQHFFNTWKPFDLDFYSKPTSTWVSKNFKNTFASSPSPKRKRFTPEDLFETITSKESFAYETNVLEML